MEKELQTIIEKVHALQADKEMQASRKLPSNAYFLNQDEIVCFPRVFGDSRYPYAFDGLTLWVYSSGNIKIEESAFNVLLDWENTGEPNMAFFFGLPNNADYFPVSITGAAKQPREQNINRYTVYTPFAAYYIAETDALDGCVKLCVDGNKNVKVKVELHNKSGKEMQTYIAAYMNLYLRHGSTQDAGKYGARLLPSDLRARKAINCMRRKVCSRERYAEKKRTPSLPKTRLRRICCRSN